MNTNNIILFGAGNNGICALKKFGESSVAYFCDNDIRLQGRYIKGIRVIAFDEMVTLFRSGYIIVVTPHCYFLMVGQLERAGIYDYLIYDSLEDQTALIGENHVSTIWDHIIKQYTQVSRDLDWLSSVDALKDMTRDILQLCRERGDIPIHSGRLGESQYYGNLWTLCQYAGVEENDIIYSPSVCHANPSPVFSPQFYKSAVIVSGTYYKEKIHRRFPYVPVFSVGPYIHYAKEWYDELEIAEIKKTIGKMLLIMLPHSIEKIQRDFYKKRFIDEAIEKYGGDFDCIWLCVLWIDVNDSICDYAEKRGVHIVSAGLRFDNMFNNRLKTIINLCDTMICGDIGTFVQYALYLNKKIGRLDIYGEDEDWGEKILDSDLERSIQQQEDYYSYKKGFEYVFGDRPSINEQQIAWAEPLAGFDQIRTREYLKNVFDISKDIWIESDGLQKNYSESVKSVFYKYYTEREFNRMRIMKEAVGGYLD